MLKLRVFLTCSIVIALAGCAGTATVPNQGGVAALPNGPASTGTRPAANAPAAKVTVAAVVDKNVQSEATIDGVLHKQLPFTFTPGWSNAPYTVVFTSLVNGAVTGTTFTFQASTKPLKIYFDPLRSVQGSIGKIEPARAFAPRPANARVAYSALNQPGPSVVRNELYVTYDRVRLDAAAVQPAVMERHTGLVARSAALVSADPSRVLRRIVLNDTASRSVAIAALRRLPGVVAVDPVYYAYTLGDVVPVSPNDPGYAKGDQWYLQAIQAPDAWRLTTGNPAVAVGIIDTGIDAHNLDLQGKIVSGESVIAGVTKHGLSASQDLEGHGTNVAGIAAAATDNGIGFAGVGYNVRLRAYRVFPNATDPGTHEVGASNADIAQAIDDAAKDGVRVVNMSLGSPASNPNDVGVANAVAAAIRGGMTIVAAAGNSALPTVSRPANLPGVISVGASAQNDRANPPYEYVSSFSNYGPDLTLVAPGGDVRPFGDRVPNTGIDNLYTTTEKTTTPCIQNKDAVTGCGYSILQGTSMASPVVAGVVALMLSTHPDLTPDRIKKVLQATADDINDPREGAGRVNAYRALAALDDKAPQTPGFHNFVALAYTVKAGSNVPQILDETYTSGIRLPSNGTFVMPDVAPLPQTYRVGLWYDANGDGIVDRGDWFGAVTCTQSGGTSARCPVGGITVERVSEGFALK
jgi:subtilisin family serine protease